MLLFLLTASAIGSNDAAVVRIANARRFMVFRILSMVLFTDRMVRKLDGRYLDYEYFCSQM